MSVYGDSMGWATNGNLELMVPSGPCNEYGSVESDTIGRRRIQSTLPEYNHQVQMSGVDNISKQLDEMRENLIKTSVRCHMLEVDLATQFSPYMVDTLRNVKQECEKCKLQIKLQEESSPAAENTETTNQTDS